MIKKKKTSIFLAWLLFWGFPDLAAQALPEVTQLKERIGKLSSNEEKEAFLDSLFAVYTTNTKSKEIQGEVNYQLGHQYYRIGITDKSEKSLNRAILLAEEAPLLVGKSRWKMGELYIFKKNEPEAAIGHLQIANKYLERDSTAGHKKYLGYAFRDIALAYTQTGEYELAEHFLMDAFKGYQTAKDTNSMAEVCGRLGLLTLSQEQWDESLQHLALANSLYLSLPEAELAPIIPLWWDVKINMAIVYLKQGLFDKALLHFQNVLDIVPLPSQFALICQTNMGYAYREKKQYDKAVKSLKSALKTSQQLLNVDFSSYFANIYDNLADVYRDQGDFVTALKYHKASIQQVVPQFRAEKDLYKNPDFKKMAVMDWETNLLTYLPYKAKTLRLLYQETKDKKDLLAALDTYKATDELIDLMRYQHKEKNSKLYWRKTTRPIYEKAIETAFLLEDAEAAFYFMEKSKAVLLADALNDRSSKEKTRLPQEKLDQIDQLKTAIFETEQDEKNRSSYLRLKNELEALIQSLEKDYPAYFQFKYNLKVPDLAILRRDLLDDSTAFLGYFTADSVIYSLQVSKKKIQLKKLPYTEKELENWQQMLRLASKGNLYNTTKKELFLSINQSLSAKLWAPLDSQINRYLIAADGWLNYLNFELLTSPPINQHSNSLQTERNQNQPFFLIQNNTFNYTWSATVSQYARRAKPKAKNQFLGIAPVKFDAFSDLANLEHSKLELSGIQQIIQGTALTVEDTKAANLLPILEKDWRIIHWTTHAYAGGKEPFIALHDKKLSLSQIYQLDFSNTEMIVLSTCESSLGEWQAGEGVASLARAFMYAGTQSVVGSQWAVNDKATAELMQLFYKNLQKKLPKDEALHQAKLQLLEKGAAPAQWAAFIAIGNPAVMDDLIESQSTWYWYIFGAFLLLVVVFTSFNKLKLSLPTKPD